MNSLVRLLQLCSQALPVGAYAYSQGLEGAIAQGHVHDAGSAQTWIAGVYQHSLVELDLPALCLAYGAWQNRESSIIAALDEYLQASRETRELLLEDTEMGKSLDRLLKTLNVDAPTTGKASFVTRFAVAGVSWNIPLVELMQGFSFSWLENQVGVATKTVPLGQSAAQKMLVELTEAVPPACSLAAEKAASQTDEWSFGSALPALAIVSSQHEYLDARLYRS